MKILLVIDPVHAFSFNVIDMPQVLSLNVTVGANHVIQGALNKASAANVRTEPFYKHSDKLYSVIELDVPLFIIVIKNYNGYTTMIHSEPTTNRAVDMTFEQYEEWKRTHKATWKHDAKEGEDKWVYVEIDPNEVKQPAKRKEKV